MKVYIIKMNSANPFVSLIFACLKPGPRKSIFLRAVPGEKGWWHGQSAQSGTRLWRRVFQRVRWLGRGLSQAACAVEHMLTQLAMLTDSRWRLDRPGAH